MHRRRFIAAAIAGLTVVPAISTHAQTPVAGFEARSMALVRYRSDDDSGIRSIVARVSLWEDDESGAAFHDYLMEHAGSDLPEGEFYESDPVEWAIPDVPNGVTPAAMEWHTTIGFAAYRTEWGLYTMRDGATVWEFWIGGAERQQVRDLGTTMLEHALNQVDAECWQGDARDLLPGSDVIPGGMERVEGEVADDDLDFPVVPSIGSAELTGTPAPGDCAIPGA